MNLKQFTTHNSELSRGFTHTLISASFRFYKIFLSDINKFLRKRCALVYCGETKKSTPNLASGFTMIETLVAIFVIMTAVVAPMSIASQALSTSRLAKEQVTAFYLAQEGIELIRTIRDNNSIADNTWNGGALGSPVSGSVCYSGSGCKLDAKDLSVSSCSGACPALNIDSSGIYTYSAGTLSSFVRTVKINLVSSDEISVTSTISWPINSSSFTTFTITDNLLNWP